VADTVDNQSETDLLHNIIILSLAAVSIYVCMFVYTVLLYFYILIYSASNGCKCVSINSVQIQFIWGHMLTVYKCPSPSSKISVATKTQSTIAAFINTLFISLLQRLSSPFQHLLLQTFTKSNISEYNVLSYDSVTDK